MNKLIPFFIIVLLLAACSIDYKPNGIVPAENDPIEYIFPETIGTMDAKIKFEFMNDSCRSISASYGDLPNIFYQIVLVNQDVIETKECSEYLFLPVFKKFGKFKTNYKGFHYFVSNDTIEMSVWVDQNYVFLMKSHPDFIEQAVQNNYYLTFE